MKVKFEVEGVLVEGIWNWSLGLKYEVEVWSWRNLKQKKFEVEEIVI